MSNTHGIPDPFSELQAVTGDFLPRCILSNTWPTVPVPPSMTLPAFETYGYVVAGVAPRLKFVYQPVLAVPLTGADGTYYLALHHDTHTPVSGWTRRPGSHYLWRPSGTHPGNPEGGLTMAVITVAGGVITAVNVTATPGYGGVLAQQPANNVLITGGRISLGGHLPTGVFDVQSSVAASDGVNAYYGVRVWPVAPSGAATVMGLAVEAATGAGLSTAGTYGIVVRDQPSGLATTGIASQVSAGTSRYNLQVTGTAQNYFAGPVGIVQPTPLYPLDVTGQMRVTGPVGLGTVPVTGYSLQTGGGWTYLAPNVGIGVTPAYPLDVTGQVHVTGSVGLDTAPVAGYSLLTGGWTSLAANVGIGISWQPQYPLDVAGQVRINDRLHVGTTPLGFASKVEVLYDKTTQQAIMIKPGGDAGGGAAMIFLNAAGVTVGTITTSGSNTFYNTSSDRRLKEAVVPLTEALATVQALRPVAWRWKGDGTPGQGFLAEDVRAVVPEAVTGAADAVDDAGQIQPMQLDASKLIPWLVGACQTLAQQVEALTARVAALEA